MNLPPDAANILRALAADPQDAAAQASLSDWLRDNPEFTGEVVCRLLSVDAVRDRAEHPLDPRFALTEFVVEADDHAYLSLWRENGNRPGADRLRWDDDTHGILVTVGHVGGRPVCVSFRWARVNGHIVCFYEATSELVDHAMVKRWLDSNCAPTWDGGRPARTDATDFHLCLEYCQRRRRK